jgi:NADH dehydrogenase
MRQQPLITLFGGSGFVGRSIVRALAARGYFVRIATRTPDACYELRTAGTPGQIVAQFYDPARPETIAQAVAGATAVVNCVGMLFERKRATFHAAHAELPRQIATACKRQGVARLVHISALGIEEDKSKYARTKCQGEQAIRDGFPGAIILRPSVIFGPDDNFFNLFATLARYLPFLPLIGGGHTQFQPVYVEDVAVAAVAVITGGPEHVGQTYELGGPDVVSFRQIYRLLFEVTNLSRPLVPLPWGLAKFKAWFWERLPGRLLTVDQVRSLETDHIVVAGAKGFAELGIAPRSMSIILPTYLDRFRPGGKFAELKRA